VTPLVCCALLGQLSGPILGWTGALSLSDRSEARLRSVAGDGEAIDLETTGLARLDLSFRRAKLVLAYSPRFGYPDVTRAPELLVVNAGRVGAEWWTKRLRLQIYQDGSVGRQTYLGLAGPATIAAEASPGAAATGGTGGTGGGGTTGGAPSSTYVPRATVLYTASLRTSAGGAYRLDRAWVVAATAGHEIGGGADAASERFLPRRRTEDGSVSVAHELTRRDQLTSRLGTSTSFVATTGGAFVTIDALEIWRHLWSKRTQGTLGAGATYLDAKTDRTSSFHGELLASGLASAVHTIPLRDGTMGARADVRLATAYNAVLGAVTQQVWASAGAFWAKDRVSASALLDAGETLPQSAPTAARFVGASVITTYAPAKVVRLDVGFRTTAQLLPDAFGGAIPAQWVAFTAVTVLAPLLEF
jgi:hypothetical protein